MRAAVLALLVVLAVNQSEGLKCHCGGNRSCANPVETCISSHVCGSLIIYVGSRPTYSRGCMSPSDCAILNQPGISSCRSCRFDLCNQ